MHLLEHLDLDALARNPKWIMGFSDISALHAAWHRAGVVSIHSSMAKHLWLNGVEDELSDILYKIITSGELPSYHVVAHPHNRAGRATATITGGNLAVLMGLLATPFNILKPGHILFIEDVSEQVYQVQRLLYHLRLAGILPHLAGLVVGQFTKHRGEETTAMVDMIADMRICPLLNPDWDGSVIEEVKIEFGQFDAISKFFWKHSAPKEWRGLERLAHGMVSLFHDMCRA